MEERRARGGGRERRRRGEGESRGELLPSCHPPLSGERGPSLPHPATYMLHLDLSLHPLVFPAGSVSSLFVPILLSAIPPFPPLPPPPSASRALLSSLFRDTFFFFYFSREVFAKGTDRGKRVSSFDRELRGARIRKSVLH